MNSSTYPTINDLSEMNTEEKIDLVKNFSSKITRKEPNFFDKLLASEEILTKLAKDESWEVRSEVARSPNTPMKVLDKLSKDKDLRVIEGITENRYASSFVNTVLYKKEEMVDVIITKNKLKNPHTTPKEIAEIKWRSCDLGALLNLATHHNTPKSVLNKLSEHPNDLFRAIACERLEKKVTIDGKKYNSWKEYMTEYCDRMGPFYTQEQQDLAEGLNKESKPISKKFKAKFKAIYKKITTIISNKAALDSRIVLTEEERKLLPIKKIESLSKSNNVHNRVIAAENKNTPNKILKKLAKDKAPHVRGALIANPNTSTEVLKLLSKDENLSWYDYEEFCYLDLSNNIMVIEKLAHNNRWQARAVAALHKDTPTSILELLSKDVHYKVNKAAELRLLGYSGKETLAHLTKGK